MIVLAVLFFLMDVFATCLPLSNSNDLHDLKLGGRGFAAIELPTHILSAEEGQWLFTSLPSGVFHFGKKNGRSQLPQDQHQVMMRLENWISKRLLEDLQGEKFSFDYYQVYRWTEEDIKRVLTGEQLSHVLALPRHIDNAEITVDFTPLGYTPNIYETTENREQAHYVNNRQLLFMTGLARAQRTGNPGTVHSSPGLIVANRLVMIFRYSLTSRN